MSTIQKLLKEWREMHYQPTYAELEAVAAEQQELLDALEEMYNNFWGTSESPGQDEANAKALVAINRHKGASA